MISNFSFPTRIVFGPGALARLPDLLDELGARRAFFVTDEGLVRAGLATRVEEVVQSRHECTTFARVESNPTEATVDAAAGVLRECGADIVVALGGGSVMDAAKAAALRLNHRRPLTEYEIQIGGDRNMTEAIPSVIAIPTTAGTGSEVGRSAVITLADGNRKAVLCGPKLLPRIALCDPELTVGLPARITAFTGMDALTHNVEAYLSSAFHPICDAVALGGVRLVAANLERAVKQGDDIEARSNMMLASSMGAIAFQKDLGAAHALAHPLSTLAGVPHGLANAIVLPHVLRFNAEAVPDRIAHVADALGCDTRSGSGADLAVEAVRALNAATDLPDTLSAVGVTEDQIPALADQAINDPNHATNPRPCTREDMESLYRLAL